MKNKIRRIFVEKKNGFDIEAQKLSKDIKEYLNIKNLKNVRIVYCYDIENIDEEIYNKARKTIFSEPPVDYVYDENIDIKNNEKYFVKEYLPGQYDQRADSASQCIQILTHGYRPNVKSSTLYIFDGEISDNELIKIKNYVINPIDSREIPLKKPDHLIEEYPEPSEIIIYDNFINLNDEELKKFLKDNDLAMDIDDLKFCQKYFKEVEKRNPTETEIKILDTYWSDHCRHTTFLTEIKKVEFEEGYFKNILEEVYNEYLKTRNDLYKNNEKPICLMDIATLAMKKLKKMGLLKGVEESEENNACSIIVNAKIDNKDEEWLVLFKNETHNHPTEIEPFGGAATCLGGAIRDPLSGRAYVYQAMRITGSGDPRTPIENTLPGKLPQRKITIEAAQGYSSYGNQIGLATGLVHEIYDNGYIAKRMEIGAVIGAVPRKNVIREKPKPGDLILLVGGRTGRDGCGGATGSSKAHNEESLIKCGAEVQKGNPVEERKLQRLFRNPEVSKMIKKCNDFGAGGVSVAIGEIADGLIIYLDKIPKKYQGLNGTELAISESQERMAVVIDKDNLKNFLKFTTEENLEATVVAEVTDNNRIKMIWKNKTIVDITGEFLNSNGAKKFTEILVKNPENKNIFINIPEGSTIKEKIINTLTNLNSCSQKGLIERFDSTIGCGTVLMPFGGKYQLTPIESMVSLLPVLIGETKTVTVMSYGYFPQISKWSPFHGAIYSIIDSICKIVATGAKQDIYLSLQEYFEKPGKIPARWGKPFAALLGAYFTQNMLNIAAIGGKDSMSGSFKDLDVPPTLVSFAVGLSDIKNIISPEFKRQNSTVILLNLKKDNYYLPDFEYFKKLLKFIQHLNNENKILAIHTVRWGGLAETISKMCFGNFIGFNYNDNITVDDLFFANIGSFVIEITQENLNEINFDNIEYKIIGNTTSEPYIIYKNEKISLEEIVNEWEKPLESIFPTKFNFKSNENINIPNYSVDIIKKSKFHGIPRVFIPVFPGTNCEYDTYRAIKNAGGIPDIFVFKNLTPNLLEESIHEMNKRINNSQIIIIPGGFSAGDEPEGSGKFIATVFRNPLISESTMNLINKRDGLILGICNGFQALIKLGLVPYGEIREMDENSPTLTYNLIGRHVSKMVRTKVISNLSPWLYKVKPGDIFTIPVSHGEGRFIASENIIKKLIENHQVATQYVDMNGNPTYDYRYNPNGSYFAIEGITSPDGRILGKMAHNERNQNNTCINIQDEKDQKIFESGIEYFL